MANLDRIAKRILMLQFGYFGTVAKWNHFGRSTGTSKKVFRRPEAMAIAINTSSGMCNILLNQIQVDINDSSSQHCDNAIATLFKN